MIDILQETMRFNNIAVSCKVILESRKKLGVCVEASLPSLCETFVIFAGGGFPESSPIAKQFHSHRTDTQVVTKATAKFKCIFLVGMSKYVKSLVPSPQNSWDWWISMNMFIPKIHKSRVWIMDLWMLTHLPMIYPFFHGYSWENHRFKTLLTYPHIRPSHRRQLPQHRRRSRHQRRQRRQRRHQQCWDRCAAQAPHGQGAGGPWGGGAGALGNAVSGTVRHVVFSL